MEIKGTLLQKLPLQTGEGKKGTWKKQDILLETDGQHPKKILVTLFNEKLIGLDLKIGNVLTAHVNPESKEFNGKWYTTILAWKVDFGNSEGITQKYDRKLEPQPEPFQHAVPQSEDDLPF